MFNEKDSPSNVAPRENGSLEFDVFNSNRFSEMQGTRGALSALDDAATSDKRLFFPSTLAETDHWICFRVADLRQLRSKAVTQENTLVYIYLPVPTSLKTGYKANYANEGLGLGGDLALAMINGESNYKDRFNKTAVLGALATDFGVSGLGTLVGGMIGEATGGGTVGTTVGAATGAAATQAAVAGLANAGIARNPHQAVLFSGTDFRTHSFNYRLQARNRQESAEINKIITAFKYYMAPKVSKSTHFFDYPQQFDIDFKNESFLFDIGTSVLTTFDVDYHAQGSPLYFESQHNGDMAPAVIDISMSFQEVTITTKDEIAKLGR